MCEYMCTCVHMYEVHVYINVRICVYLYVSTHVHCVCVYGCAHIGVCRYTYTCVSKCVDAHVHVGGACVCVCGRQRERTRVHFGGYIYVGSYISMLWVRGEPQMSFFRCHPTLLSRLTCLVSEHGPHLHLFRSWITCVYHVHMQWTQNTSCRPRL